MGSNFLLQTYSYGSPLDRGMQNLEANFDNYVLLGFLCSWCHCFFVLLVVLQACQLLHTSTCFTLCIMRGIFLCSNQF